MNRILFNGKKVMPIPFAPNKLTLHEGGKIRLQISPNTERRPFTVELQGGKDQQRSRAVLLDVISGKATAIEFALCEIAARRSDHRPLSGKNRRLAIKIVVQKRRPPKRAVDTKVLHVASARDVFLRYWIDGQAIPRELACDHVRRWAMAHRKKLDRTSKDLKRWHVQSRQKRRHILEARRAWSKKHDDRIKRPSRKLPSSSFCNKCWNLRPASASPASA